MSEESLKILSVNDLCEIMIKAIGEYLLLEKLNDNKDHLDKKRAELKINHKVIAGKTAQKVH